MAFKRPAKKSELLRAGLQALAALPDAKLKAALDSDKHKSRVKADIDAANANPAFKLLLAAYPNLATLDAEAVRVLGELSAIEQRLKPILDGHGLALVSGWYSTMLLERDARAEIAAMQAHLRLLKDMGCGVLIAAECSGTVHGDRTKALADRPILAAGDWAQFAARLTDVAKAVEYLDKAGDKALSLSQAGPALDYYRRAVNLLSQVEATPEVNRQRVSIGLKWGRLSWARPVDVLEELAQAQALFGQHLTPVAEGIELMDECRRHGGEGAKGPLMLADRHWPSGPGVQAGVTRAHLPWQCPQK